jgi:hypothetical protein
VPANAIAGTSATSAEKLSRAKPQNPAPIADPVSPQNETATQRPVADAHAELPLPQTRVEQETSVSALATDSGDNRE